MGLSLDEQALINKQIEFITNSVYDTKVINRSAMTSAINVVSDGRGYIYQSAENGISYPETLCLALWL